MLGLLELFKNSKLIITGLIFAGIIAGFLKIYFDIEHKFKKLNSTIKTQQNEIIFLKNKNIIYRTQIKILKDKIKAQEIEFNIKCQKNNLINKINKIDNTNRVVVKPIKTNDFNLTEINNSYNDLNDTNNINNANNTKVNTDKSVSIPSTPGDYIIEIN